ncbi:helix-turn-helix domain-containing protein [Streptomyces sp. NPDC050658]|uniref:helix-turn-helix domain-containing protein n=1 Tax=unclassified Streptomyces TaxID=2593676 RepID=UPI003423AA84
MASGTRYARCPLGSWEVALAAPHPRLRPGVISYRGIRLALGRPRRRLEVPIGAVTLMLGFARPVRISGLPDLADLADSADSADSAEKEQASVSLVSVLSGLGTTPVIGEHDGDIAGIEVLLAPWAAFTLFGTALHELHELADLNVDPDALGVRPEPGRWGSVAELASALGALPSWSTRFALLDDAFDRWSAAGPPPCERTVRAWGELVRTGGAAPVGHIADEVGWSVRQLESRFRERIGIGPKAAGRVLRLQRARRLLAAGRTQAETAAVCGYYDQSHLSGEFKAMTGCTPREFAAVRRTARPRGGPPSADRIADQPTSLVLP